MSQKSTTWEKKKRTKKILKKASFYSTKDEDEKMKSKKKIIKCSDTAAYLPLKTRTTRITHTHTPLKASH